MKILLIQFGSCTYLHIQCDLKNLASNSFFKKNIEYLADSEIPDAVLNGTTANE